MRKITFGTPEKFVPSHFCKNFNYIESEVKYDIDKIKCKITSRGILLELPLEFEEQIYGFGLQLKGFNHKSHKLHLRANSDPVANSGDSHAPVPFFVTTNGYGIYIDTARPLEVYCGYGKNLNRPPVENNTIIASAEDLYKKCALVEQTTMAIDIPHTEGVDIYIIEGESITDIVSQYNMLSGGGCDISEWGCGVLYRCYAKYTENEVKAIADYFRDNDIPCDILGLEPGWQSSSYSCSFVWDNERFPNYKELIKYLKDKNYHINLWEHAFVNSTSPIYQEMRKFAGDYEVWKGLIPDFSIDEARSIFAKHHKEYLIDEGIDGFKLDECDNSDFVHDWSFPNCTEFPSGMDGELYHSLFGTLYMQAIMEALGETKTLSEVRNAWALCSGYPFVLYSDLYDHQDFIRGVVNSGFSGLLWSPEVREATSKKDMIRRIETVVFSVQCLINAWYCEEAPWKELGCEDEVRRLLKVRKTIEPKILQAFRKYRNTGVPVTRALVMDYTDDEQTYNIDDEYLFCDDMLVAPMTANQDTRMVYLPKGEWVNFWTGKKQQCGWFEYSDEQIPVYIKG